MSMSIRGMRRMASVNTMRSVCCMSCLCISPSPYGVKTVQEAGSAARSFSTALSSGLRRSVTAAVGSTNRSISPSDTHSQAGRSGFDENCRRFLLLHHHLRQYSSSSSSTTTTTTSQRQTESSRRHSIVIAGGGTGGLAVASRLQRMLASSRNAADRRRSIAVIEPSSVHFYQPLFTLIGGGLAHERESYRDTASLIPEGVEWYRTNVSNFDCADNCVRLAEGPSLVYDVLIVALGMETNWTAVRGLREALADPLCPVVTNYGYHDCQKTWKHVRNFRGGAALFTMPSKPLKCPGAPQKVMFLSEDHWRREGLRRSLSVKWMSGLATQFAVPEYSKALSHLCDSRGIERHYLRNLVAIRPEMGEADFEVLDPPSSSSSSSSSSVVAAAATATSGDDVRRRKKKEEEETSEAGARQEEESLRRLTTEKFDFLHVGPSQRPPEVLRQSSDLTASPDGLFMEVNQHTLESGRYPNVLGLGDCTNVPTSRTAAATAVQSNVVAQNALHILLQRRPKDAVTPAGAPTHLSSSSSFSSFSFSPFSFSSSSSSRPSSQMPHKRPDVLPQHYNGYASCPLVCGNTECIMAEFNAFTGRPRETFPFDQSIPRASMFFLNKYILPEVYWRLMTTGRWKGPETFRRLFAPFSVTKKPKEGV